MVPASFISSSMPATACACVTECVRISVCIQPRIGIYMTSIFQFKPCA